MIVFILLCCAWLTFAVRQCNKCGGEGSGWWVFLHRTAGNCQDKWHKEHPGMSEEWKP